MGRRKQQFLDDSDSDSDVSRNESEGYNSQEDADSRLERNLFERKRKRRRTDGKQSAWEGVFGEDDEDQGHRSRNDRRGEKSSTAFKPPTFVTSAQKEESSKQGESNENPVELGDSDSEDDDSEAEEKRARPLFVREPSNEEEEEDDQPRGLGIGANNSQSGFGGAGIGAGTGGIGTRNTGGGIGSGAASSGNAGRTPTFAAASASSTFTLSDTPMPTSTALEDNSQSATATDDAPLDMLSGIGTASRARLEEVEEEVLHPKDDAHAYPQGFGRQSRRQPDSNAQSRANSRGSTPGIGGGGIGSNRQRAFAAVSDAPSTSSTSQPRPDVTDKDLRHLTSIANTFGARMLAKSGWVPGKGLGADEGGKAVPIEANVGLQRGQGIGKGVRTEQSRRDARARGEVFSSDEEAERRKTRKAKNRDVAAGRGQEPSKGESASWKKQRKVRVKVEHKTYEQLIAEAGDRPMANSGMGLVLDARGGELKEVSSIAAATASSHWTPSSDKTQLPELRHNLRLILDVTTGDVAALAKEGKGIEEKKKWAVREAEKQERLQSTNENKILRLQSIHTITQHISSLATDPSPTDAEDPLNKFEDDFTRLIEEFRAEYDEYDLDEVLVGAISQALAPLFRDFEPLKGSPILLRSIQRWKRAYRYSETQRSGGRSVEVYGAAQSANENGYQPGVMTPFESLIYHLWLPRVRSAINNDWDVADPQPAVDLIESWGPVLPRFVLDNVIEQLVVPKVYKQVRDWSWSPRRAKAGHPVQSLASIVFPWLATLKTRADHILDEAKIRIGEVMKRWSFKDAIPEELKLWKDVFSRGKWDTLVLLNILPKLAQHLDGEFEINPRAQEMAPLDRVLGWSSLMRESTFGQLLEEKFFPAWLDTLHFWLIQPDYSAGEVASWYHYWKDYLANYTTSDGTKLTENRRVDHGFRTGLKLMNEAMSLGAEAPGKLAKPEFKPLQDKKSRDTKSKEGRPKTAQPDQPEITFRSIAEQHAVEHNLLFIPTGKSHSATGKQLFKISKNPDGRGGITAYIGDDAVYAMGEDGSFRPVLLDDMVKMASKR